MGGRIAGITIEINGDTKNLQKSLKGVNGDIKNTQSQLKDVEKLLKLDPTNTELLQQRQQLLVQAVSQTKEKLQQLKEAQAQMDAEGVDKSSEAYMGLQREIIATEQSLQELEKAAAQSDATLAKIGATADKVAAGAEKVADKTKALSTAAAGALAAIAALAIKSATSADDLNTLAKQTGFSTAELQKMQYAADRIDVPMETIVAASQKLTKQMGAGSSAFGELGVSITNADGSMRSSTEVFYDTIAALSNIENETERDALAMEIFGKSAAELSGVIDDGGEALREFGQEAEDAGLILDQETLDGLNEVNDEIDRLKAKSAASLAKAGASALKALTPVIETVVAAGEKVLNVVANLNPQQMRLIVGVLAVVAAISPMAKLVAKTSKAVSGATKVFSVLRTGELLPIIGTVAAVVAVVAVLAGAFTHLMKTNEGFSKNITKIWSDLSAKFESFSAGLLERINGLGFNFESMADVMKAAWDGLCNFLAPIFETAFSVVSTVLSTAMDVILGIIDTWTAIINGDWSAAWEACKGIVSSVMNGAKQILASILPAIKALLSKAWTAIKSITSSVWNAIKSVISTAINNAKTAATNAATLIRTALTSAWNTVKSTTTSVWNAVKSAITTPINTAKAAVTAAATLIRTSLSSAWNAIKGTASSVWNAIKSAITSPMESAKQAVSDVIDAIKGFFDFTFTWPHIPMPHFSVNPPGWKASDLLSGTIPTLGISWYAKAKDQPFMFQNATLFGAGEAGDEVLYGRAALMRDIKAAVGSAGSTNTTISVTVNAAPGMDERTVADLVARRLQQQVERRQAVWA